MASLIIVGLSETQKPSQAVPEAITFTNPTNEVAKYYFKNNPWRFSECNNFQKIFRFCIICGAERFSDEEWSKVLVNMWGKPPTICKKASCRDSLAFVPEFVPRDYYMVGVDRKSRL